MLGAVAELRGVDGGWVWVECGSAGGLYAFGGTGERGADGGRVDAADYGDVECSEWL